MATRVSAVRSNGNGYQPSYIPAAIATVLVFVLYLLTLAPSVAMWDTGEYMAAVKVLGIPHPPGNPFFVLLGHAFASLPIPVSYAARINIMAALASACSAGLWFLITERIVAAPGRGQHGDAHSRHGVHGVESVRGEREGLHHLAALLHHRVVGHHRVDRGP